MGKGASGCIATHATGVNPAPQAPAERQPKNKQPTEGERQDLVWLRATRQASLWLTVVTCGCALDLPLVMGATALRMPAQGLAMSERPARRPQWCICRQTAGHRSVHRQPAANTGRGSGRATDHRTGHCVLASLMPGLLLLGLPLLINGFTDAKSTSL